MAKNIVTLNLDNTDYSIRPYGTCSTTTSTVAKTVSITGFTLCAGATVLVKFDNINSATSPTLNINSTGAKPIKWKGVSNDFLDANVYYEFMYDGINWVVLGEASRLNEIVTPTNDFKYPLCIKYTGESGSTEEFVYAGSESQSETLDLSGIFVLNSQKITYSELVSLKNSSQLAQGRQYRITDYRTTVYDPLASSAGHRFDVIVTADGPNRLSEIAKVCKHDDDGTITADHVKTSTPLDFTMQASTWMKLPNNQVSEIPAGIKAVMPSGVVEANYDVRHGQFTKNYPKGILKAKFQWKSGSNAIHCVGVDMVQNGQVIVSDYHWGSTGYANSNNEYYLNVPEEGSYVLRYFIEGNTGNVDSSCQVTAECYTYVDYFANSKLEAWDIKYCLDNDTSRFGWAASNGTGVIYYMKDEFDNICPYDFKNVLFGGGYYTFSCVGDTITDYTIYNQNKCYNNSIEPYYYDEDKAILYLNTNIFKINSGEYCHSNMLGPNCHDNTFGSNCKSNTLAAGCYRNTFGNNCENNILKANCYGNVFGYSCVSNELDADCTSNGFGDFCSYNVFASFCKSNEFANYSQSNTLGVYCMSISLGEYSLRCDFGKKCYNCKMTNAVTGNFTTLTYVNNIKFGNECSGVKLYPSSNTNPGTSNYFQNYTLGNGLTGNIEVTGADARNRSYETIIKKDSSGNIKQVKGVVEHYTYTLPTATSDVLGGIKIGYSENNKNYAVQLSDGKAYVNVPWVDNNDKVTSVGNHYKPNNTDQTKTSGLYKIATDEAGHVTGAVAVTKSDITSLGIPESDTKYNHPASPAGAKTQGLYKITTDVNGHVTDAVAVTKSDITSLGIPESDNDTKVTSVGNHYKNNDNQAKTSGLYKITTDAAGHVTGAVAVTKSDITGLGIPESDTKYNHPASPVGAKTQGLYKITTDVNGHVTDAVAVTKDDITSLGIPEKNTTYSDATTTTAGLMSTTDKSKLDGIATGANNYVHPTAGKNTGSFGTSTNSSVDHGGILKIPYVTVDSDGHVTAASDVAITLPNQYTLPTAANDKLGGIKIGYTQSGKNYPVELSDGKAYVNVPWTDTDTDTKNTAGSTNSTSKMFLIGATSQAANPQTYSNSKIYATDGELTATKFNGGLGSELQSSVNNCYSNMNLKFFRLGGCTASEATNYKRYAGTVDSYGFPVLSNANGLLWLGSHDSIYGHQLGFSSDDKIYYRNIIAGSFPTTANGGSWKTIAFTSDIPSIPGVATTSSNGLMSSTDKSKLDNIVAATNTEIDSLF